MGCGCRGARVNGSSGKKSGDTVAGYYVTLRDGTEIPNVSAGDKPFLSIFEARVEVNKAGGGTIRPLKQSAAR